VKASLVGNSADLRLLKIAHWCGCGRRGRSRRERPKKKKKNGDIITKVAEKAGTFNEEKAVCLVIGRHVVTGGLKKLVGGESPTGRM